MEAICQVYFQVDYQTRQKRFTLEKGVSTKHKSAYVISLRVCCSIILVSETHTNKVTLKCYYPLKKNCKKLSSYHKCQEFKIYPVYSSQTVVLATLNFFMALFFQSCMNSF